MSLKITYIRAIMLQNHTTNHTTFGVLSMVKEPTFGNPFIKAGKKQTGVYYLNAYIPVENRHIIFPSSKNPTVNKTKPISLKTKDLAEANRRVPDAKADFIKHYHRLVSAHDPLLSKAEKLLESLVVKYDEQNKKANEEDYHWSDVGITFEELKLLKYRDTEEQRLAYDRLVNKLRFEAERVIRADGNQDPFDVLERSKKVELLANFVEKNVSYKKGSEESKENIKSFIQEVKSQAKPEHNQPYHYKWSRVAELHDMVRDYMSDEPDADYERALHYCLKHVAPALNITEHDIKRYHRILTLFEEFYAEHESRVSGRGLSGKRFQDAVDSYWKQPDIGVASNKSTQEYKMMQRDFLDTFGNKDLADITFGIGKEYKNKLANRTTKGGNTMARGTIEKYITAINNVLVHAVGEGWIAKNPWDSKEFRKHKRGIKRRKYKNISPEQQRKLFSLSLPPDVRMLFQILSATGFRTEEGASLGWEDVTIDEKSGVKIFDLIRVNKILKTEWAERRVPIHDELLPYLDNFKKETKAGNKGRLFPHFKINKDGKVSKPVSNKLMYWFRKIRNQGEGREIAVHSLRGTFTTMCAEHKLADSSRKYIGGWSQSENDAFYLQMGRDLKAVKKIVNTIDISFLKGG